MKKNTRIGLVVGTTLLCSTLTFAAGAYLNWNGHQTIEDTKSYLYQLKDTVGNLKDSNADKDKIISELEKEIEKLEDQISGPGNSGHVEEAKHLRAELEKANKDAASLQSVLDEVKTELGD